jgi:predicted NACHT family NTPase
LDSPLSFVCNLSNITRPAQNPTKGLNDYLREKAWSRIGLGEDIQVGDFVLEQISGGRALLIIDGLDEAFKLSQRVKVIRKILPFSGANNMVVTSRIVGYDAAPLTADFQVVRVDPFSSSQVWHFLNNWARITEKERMEASSTVDPDLLENRIKIEHGKLLRALGLEDKGDGKYEGPPEDDPRSKIVKLEATPILATLMGLIYRQGNQLPDDRCRLYQLFVEAMVYDWEAQKRISNKDALDLYESLDVLELVAEKLHDEESGSGNTISRDELVNTIQQYLVEEQGCDPDRAHRRTTTQMGIICDRATLLIERGQNEYGFNHIQIQEYLAGRALVKRRYEIAEKLKQRLWQLRCREPILLAVAHLGHHSEEDASEFVDQILATPSPHFGHRGLDLESQLHLRLLVAAECLKEVRRIHHSVRNRVYEDFVHIFQNSERSYFWPDASKVLKGCKEEELSRALNELLAKTDDSDVQWRAASALGQIGGEGEIRLLFDWLEMDEFCTRWSAVYQALKTIAYG